MILGLLRKLKDVGHSFYKNFIMFLVPYVTSLNGEKLRKERQVLEGTFLQLRPSSPVVAYNMGLACLAPPGLL